MLYLSAFLSLSGGDNFPKTGSKNAPGDAPGSLARVSNVYCLVFGEPLVFGEAALDRHDRRSAGFYGRVGTAQVAIYVRLVVNVPKYV